MSQPDLAAARLCARPDCRTGPGYTRDTEFRIDGYCSVECRDTHELEQERDALLAQNAALRAVLDDTREWIATFRINQPPPTWQPGPMLEILRDTEAVAAAYRQQIEQQAREQERAAMWAEIANASRGESGAVNAEKAPNKHDAWEFGFAAAFIAIQTHLRARGVEPAPARETTE